MIPCLNEEEGMRQMIPRIDRGWCHQILVADGQSHDGTVAYPREVGLEVYVQRGPGIRRAYVEAMGRVTGDIVITFSADGNCIPEVIPELIARMREGYDMVIASRYFQGLKSEDDDLVTGFGNWLFTVLINTLHGGTYSDPMNVFRAWRREVFYRLDLHREETYAPERWFNTVIGLQPILSIRAAKARLRCAEIAGFEPARIGGVRKLQVMRWGASYLAQILRELVFWRPPRA